jgi:threonine synthase
MAVYERLLGEGELRAEDAVVVFDPGLRSVEKMAEALRVRRPACLPRSMPVGGIITPV